MGAEISLDKIPILDGASDILENTSIRSTLSTSNKRSVRISNDPNTKNTSLLDILFDPQTSGGIVAVVPAIKADKITRALRKSAAPHTAIIGSLTSNKTGIITN